MPLKSFLKSFISRSSYGNCRSSSFTPILTDRPAYLYYLNDDHKQGVPLSLGFPKSSKYQSVISEITHTNRATWDKEVRETKYGSESAARDASVNPTQTGSESDPTKPDNCPSFSDIEFIQIPKENYSKFEEISDKFTHNPQLRGLIITKTSDSSKLIDSVSKDDESLSKYAIIDPKLVDEDRKEALKELSFFSRGMEYNIRKDPDYSRALGFEGRVEGYGGVYGYTSMSDAELGVFQSILEEFSSGSDC